MPNHRPIAFVLASTHTGAMLVNRNDYNVVPSGTYGVGHQILTTSSYDQGEVDLALKLLEQRHKHFGSGVFAIDCGANIGVHTIAWAKEMDSWGEVLAIEAQERIFYALAGNLTLNNCFNAQATWAAVGESVGEILVPELEPTRPASFGSLELREMSVQEKIGQPRNQLRVIPFKMLSIDSLAKERVDLIKIDVEGMELEALRGACLTIERCLPHLIIKKIKSDESSIIRMLNPLGYRFFQFGINLVAVHKADPSINILPRG